MQTITMSGYESDEFLCYEFDELYVFDRERHTRRSTTQERQAEYNNNRIAQVNKNLQNVNRKFDYGIDEYTDEEEVDEADHNQGLSDCDSSTDEELADEEMNAEFLSPGGSKAMGGEFERPTLAEEEVKLVESKILKINRQIRRHGCFKCHKCKITWESSNVYCTFDGFVNRDPIYTPIRGMSCKVCDTRNYPSHLRPPGRARDIKKRR